MSLVACNIRLPSPVIREQFVGDLRRMSSPPLLVLDTCQRLECFGHVRPEAGEATVTEAWEAQEAFERLARIAAGLESRILGELEVLGQVRRAYKAFRATCSEKANGLDRIFQDALALARKARRESGIDRNLTSLSGLGARELLSRVAPGEPVAVVGSGSLAGSAARYLSKRGNSPVIVASRCPERAMQLAEQVGGFGAGLDELTPLLKGVSGIITATAAPHPVLYPRHLVATRRPLTIIDLGEPADCSSEVQAMDNIHYLNLLEMEQRAQVNTADRMESAKVASRIIREAADAWATARARGTRSARPAGNVIRSHA